MDMRMESMKAASLRGDMAFNPPSSSLIENSFQILRSPFTFDLLVLIESLGAFHGEGLYFVSCHDEEMLCEMC